MDQKKLIGIFKNVGLSEKHLKIYLYLLEFGPNKASRLAVFLRLNRSVIYEYLDALVEANLIVLLPDAKVNTYMANPPESIKVLIENQVYKNKRSLYEFDKILSEMEFLQNKCEQVTEVVFYKGELNCDMFFKKLYSQTFFGTLKFLVSSQLFSLDDTPLYDLLAKYKPHTQELRCVEGEVSEDLRLHVKKCLEVNPNHQVRFVNFKNLSAKILIQNDQFYMYDEECLPHVIDVRSRSIASLQSQMFDVLWENAKEFKI